MIGMLIDVTRCIGCEQCVAACVAENGLDPDLADRDRATAPDGLSANRFTTVEPVGWNRLAKKACMHCLEPSCVSACLVGGLTRQENGAVVYDPEKCIGCRYCMLACPFHIPRYQWSKTVPFVRKCELCRDRLAEGKIPACVEACPQQAIAFGTREEMLLEAQRRIESDDRYFNWIWGKTEFGGTGVLYISDVDLGELGWPGTKTEAIPKMVAPVLHATPWLAGSVLAGVTGIQWIVKRRMEQMREDSPQSTGEAMDHSDGKHRP